MFFGFKSKDEPTVGAGHSLSLRRSFNSADRSFDDGFRTRASSSESSRQSGHASSKGLNNDIHLESGCANAEISLSSSSLENEPLSANDTLDHLLDEYIDTYYFFHPVHGPESGFHKYDGAIDSFSEESIKQELEFLNNFKNRANNISKSMLTARSIIDLDVFKRNIEAKIFNLKVLRNYKRDPQFYSDILQDCLMWQMIFDYTDINERSCIVEKILKSIPRFLAEAKENLTEVPKELRDLGADSWSGTRDYIVDDVMPYFQDQVTDIELRNRLNEAMDLAIKEIDTMIDFIKELPENSHLSYAIGSENLKTKLLLEEGIQLDVSKTLSELLTLIAKDKSKFSTLAKQIDKESTTEEIWKKIMNHHPEAGQIVKTVKDTINDLKAYLETHDIIDISEVDDISILRAPDFMFWWYASMWQTGPYENKKDIKGVYYVSDFGVKNGKIDYKDISEEDVESFLESMNYATIITTSIHEALPGHLVQGAYLRKVNSKVGRINIFAPYSFSEGWAHYAEEMLIESGYLEGQPLGLELRMEQTSEALLRYCRAYVGIKLHTDKSFTVEDGIKFFMENAFTTDTAARAEADRGTYDPSYILYAIGKIEILKVRQQYQEAHRSDFSLAKFHREFLSNGQYSIPLIAEMLGLKSHDPLLEQKAP